MVLAYAWRSSLNDSHLPRRSVKLELYVGVLSQAVSTTKLFKSNIAGALQWKEWLP